MAGAGSGKTRVLTLRVARRIRDGSAEADHTAVCTFTRKAARELRGRLALYGVPVSTAPSAGGGPGPGVRAGTLHQLALTLLRRHALDGRTPPPVVVEHRFRLIRDIVGDPAMASAAETEIGWAKARCLTPDRYAEAAEAAGRVTVADTDRVAEPSPSTTRPWPAAVPLTSMTSWSARATSCSTTPSSPSACTGGTGTCRWTSSRTSTRPSSGSSEALLGTRQDLCAVGDPNQAIYGWNGADPTLLGRLPDAVPGMEVVRLDENHRSTPQVVAAASAGLGRSAAVPPRSLGADGPMPVVTAFDDEAAEAEGVVSLILERSEEGTILVRPGGAGPHP